MSVLQSSLCLIYLCSVLCTHCSALPNAKILHSFLSFHLCTVFSFGIIKSQLSRYCVCWLLLFSFSNMWSRATTSLPSPPSLNVFRHCLPQHCLFALRGTGFPPLLQPQCQWFRNGNCLWNSPSVFRLYLPATASCHPQRTLCFLSSCFLSLPPTVAVKLICLWQIKWLWRGREGATPQFQHTKSMLVCTLFLGQECSLLLVGITPFFCTDLQLCTTCMGGPNLFNSTCSTNPVAQNMTILSEWSDNQDDLGWWCMYLVFKYLSCHDQETSLNSAFFMVVIWLWLILGKISQTT